MIKKFISKLLGLPESKAAAPGKPSFGKRVEVPFSSHGIDASLVDERAANVVRTLQQAGFVAYIVGGAVRLGAKLIATLFYTSDAAAACNTV